MRNFFKDNPYICFITINNFTGAYSLLTNRLIIDTDSAEIGFKCNNILYGEKTNYFNNPKTILINLSEIIIFGDYYMREQQKRINNITYDYSEASMLHLIENYSTTPLANDTLDMRSLFEITDKYYKNEI